MNAAIRIRHPRILLSAISAATVSIIQSESGMIETKE